MTDNQQNHPEFIFRNKQIRNDLIVFLRKL